MLPERTSLPVVEVDLGEGVRAGFTMRAGGVSGAPFASLNLGLHVADDPADVLANRRRLERWVGGPVAFATQVHGAEVTVVDPGAGPDAPADSLGEFDALVARSGAGIAVLAADCVPVLLADPVAGVVGAVHAGRGGLVAGVVQVALAAMTGLGARPGRIRAAIGPAICGACYEVPAELRAEVSAVVPGTWATTSWGTASLDLPAGVAATLAGAGVGSIERVAICTLTDDRFYSHRGACEGGATGRSAGVIRADSPGPGRVGADR